MILILSSASRSLLQKLQHSSSCLLEQRAAFGSPVGAWWADAGSKALASHQATLGYRGPLFCAMLNELWAALGIVSSLSLLLAAGFPQTRGAWLFPIADRFVVVIMVCAYVLRTGHEGSNKAARASGILPVVVWMGDDH